MKISNETKIGVLAVVAIALLILGFNFLKGKNVFGRENKLYAVYSEVQGLSRSNPVVVNGLQIGRIENLDGGKDMRRILVTIILKEDVRIPDNSIAMINPNLLGSPSMEIQLGNSRNFLKNGDTLLTSMSSGAFDQALKMINPVLYEVRNAVRSLDSVMQVVTNVFDTKTEKNIQGIVRNLNEVTASFAVSAHSLEQMLNVQEGALSRSLKNVEGFTGNLNRQSSTLDSILLNSKVASAKLASVNLSAIVDTLSIAINSFKEGAEKINSTEGSLGMLLNDKELYQNLNSTANKLNILLDDIRVHPRRYVNVSIFGKKDQGNYLTAPIVDDTIMILNK